MHPDCSIGRLRLWSATDSRAKAKLKYVFRRDPYDFIVWGMTDGAEYLRFQWGSKDAWVGAVQGYRRSIKLAWLANMASTETDALVSMADTANRKNGNTVHGTLFPDTKLWIRECVSFLTKKHNGTMAAYFLEVIELSDLATLCYRGDMMAAKDAVLLATIDLREWYDGKELTHDT